MSEKQNGWYEKTDRAIVKTIKTISIASGICLLGIMLIAFVNVIVEKTMHTSIPASTEMIQYLHVPVVFLAAGYVTLDQGHTRIDLLSKHLPHTVQKICLTIGDLCAVGICSFVCYMGFVRMQDALEHHTKSSTTGTGFALWPFMLVFSIGFALLAFTFLWSIVRRFVGPAKETTDKGGNA